HFALRTIGHVDGNHLGDIQVLAIAVRRGLGAVGEGGERCAECEGNQGGSEQGASFHGSSPLGAALGLWPRALAAICQTMVRVTSMLPRVALEYGQTMCARSTRVCAASRSRPGRLMRSSTSMPKPVGMAPIPTVPSMKVSAGMLSLSRAATNFRAPRKQAE